MLFIGERKRRITAREFDRELERLIEWVKASVSPFPADTPEEQDRRRRRAKEDQDFFNETYLPHYFKEPSAAFHRELEALMDEGERQQRPVAVAAPRGFAKSTRITFARTLKRILFREKIFPVIISDTLDQAKGLTVSIRVECEHNPRIRHDFGGLTTDQWAAADFILSNGARVLARGDGQGVRGVKHGPHRPDLAIIDDIESDESVRNPQRVKQTYQWVMEAVYPSLDPAKGVLFWIGTLLSRKSALARALANPEFLTRTYRAITEAGTSLWPERFPLERLEKIKALIGSIAFNKEYQNDPRDEEGLFREEWIRYYTEADYAAMLAEGGVLLYDYLDPSMGRSEHSDFRAFVKVANVKGRIYVRRPDIQRRSVASIVQTAYARQVDEPAAVIGIEAVGFQAVLKELFDREAESRRLYLPIRLVDQTLGKEQRVARLSAPIENGVIRFPKGDPMADLLVEQLLSFPSSTVHDDGPDALEGAYSLAVGLGRPEEWIR